MRPLFRKLFETVRGVSSEPEAYRSAVDSSAVILDGVSGGGVSRWVNDAVVNRTFQSLGVLSRCGIESAQHMSYALRDLVTLANEPIPTTRWQRKRLCARAQIIHRSLQQHSKIGLEKRTGYPTRTQSLVARAVADLERILSEIFDSELCVLLERQTMTQELGNLALTLLAAERFELDSVRKQS